MQVVEAAVGVTAGAMPAYHLGDAVNQLQEVEVFQAQAVVDLSLKQDYVAICEADHHLPHPLCR